ncbi:MAG: hypothetical protein WC821_00060 [archaeon]|jgi:hypothetical protein
MSKKKAEHKKIVYEGQEIADLVTIKNDNEKGKSTMMGLSGDPTHLNNIIGADGTFSLHSTTRAKGQKEEHKNLFPSTDVKEAVEVMAKDAETKIMSKEYLGDDLLYMDYGILLKMVGELTKLNSLDSQNQVADIGKNFENIQKLVDENRDTLLKEISRDNLKDYEGKVLINKEKKPLLVYKGKVYDQSTFQEDFYKGISGNFFGYTGLNMDSIQKSIESKLKEKKTTP